MTRRLTLALLPLLVAARSRALAQLPTSQPALIKLGRDTDHAKVEARWPAAYEKAKSPDYYLALTSMTGTPEAWYIAAHAPYAAIGIP